MFNLPIPIFDSAVPLHTDIAAAGAEAAKVAAAVTIPDGEKFVAARKRIRSALKEHGIGGQIEKLVDSLLRPA